MATTARFTRNGTKLELDDIIYKLGADFTPPPLALEYNLASGTSLNRTGGAELIGTRSLNRTLDFTVDVRGSNEAANIAAARRLAGFINAGAGDGLYFEWCEFPGLPEPLWGQFGAWIRYEVVTANAQLNDLFGRMGRGANVQVEISLQVKPYALGNKQRLINAAGWVFENNYGSATGEALGLSIHEATTNKMTNPVFGHATFGNGWTAGAGLIVTKNTDTAFCLPGVLQSAKIVAPAAEVYSQSINAGNTNKHSFSAYVYLPDGGAPTASDCYLVYNTPLATTYKNLGNGLYLIHSDNVDGINATTSAGIAVTAAHTVYLCGFQMEEKAYHTPLSYGDLLGCAWTGTAHASTSTRTATNIKATRTDDFIRLEEGAVSVVWRAYNANTFGAAEVLWELDGPTLRGYFENTDDKIYLTDGTNTISTAAQTFSAGDVLYLTFTWGPGGLNIYKSGVNAATGATYTSPSLASSATFYIGGINSAYPANGDILGFDVYPTEITSTQAAALYTAQAAIVAGGKRVSSIPWLWTKDGDGVVDNCNDSTHDNFCVAGGVPGSEVAITMIDGTSSSLSVGDQRDLYLSVGRLPYFISPSLLYSDESGTADANSSGGAYLQSNISNAAEAVISTLITINYGMYLWFKDFRTITAAFRISDASTDARVRIRLSGAGAYIYSAYTYLSTGAGQWGLDSSGSIFLPIVTNQSTEFLDQNTTLFSVDLRGMCNAASSTVNLDYWLILPRPIVRIGRADTTDYDTHFIYSSIEGAGIVSSFSALKGSPSTEGDTVEFSPQKYNVLISLIGGKPTNPTIANTITYKIYVTPRWGLL